LNRYSDKGSVFTTAPFVGVKEDPFS